MHMILMIIREVSFITCLSENALDFKFDIIQYYSFVPNSISELISQTLTILETSTNILKKK